MKSTVSRVYVDLPTSTGNGLYYVRVASSDNALMFAESDRFYIDYTGDSGIYKGEQNNLLNKDYETALASSIFTSIPTFISLLILLGLHL